MDKPMRSGVVGVFVNARGEILICERSMPRGAWQLPQGGIDANEDARTAVLREMREELGISDMKILAEGSAKTAYLFPAGLPLKIAASYAGQEHTWFKLELPAGAEPDLHKSDGEFVNWRWAKPAELLPMTVDWKASAYENGLRILGLLS